jgi:hypothetical protein
MACSSEVAFWHTCAYAPIIENNKKTILKMSKKSDIIFLVYIVISYVRSQVFVEKQHFVWCVQKRQKNILYVVVLQHQNLSFLQEPQKNVFF